MHAFPCSFQAAGASRLLAAIAVAAAALLTLQSATSAQDVDAAIYKANLYIEIAKLTERAGQRPLPACRPRRGRLSPS